MLPVVPEPVDLDAVVRVFPEITLPAPAAVPPIVLPAAADATPSHAVAG